MRFTLGIVVGLVLTVSQLLAGKLEYTISQVGTARSGDLSYRYTYFWSGDPIPEGFELDIRFDPAVFQSISNGIADEDFDVLLLQPNNPPGFEGIFSLFALVDNADLSAPFSIEFTLLPGMTAKEQELFINRYDPKTGTFLGTIERSQTSQVADDTVAPEPATVVLIGMGCLALSLARQMSRRRQIIS